MKIVEISYERIHNLGNYENEKVAAIALVHEGEKPEEIYRQLKRFVEKQLFA